MGFFWRVWGAVIAVNLAVLAVFIGLAPLQFDVIHSGLVGERLGLLATRTAAPFEQAARLGLGLASVRNADGLLERARQTDEAITAIHVFNPEGRILHSTERTPPEAIPPGARAARAGAGALPWHVEADRAFLAGADIKGRDGRSAGGVLVVYAAAQNAARIGAMSAELIVSGVLVLLASMGFGALVLRLGLRRQIRAFDAIETDIAVFEREAWRSAAAAPLPPPAGDGGMRGMLDEAEARYRAAGRAIAAAGEPG